MNELILTCFRKTSWYIENSVHFTFFIFSFYKYLEKNLAKCNQSYLIVSNINDMENFICIWLGCTVKKTKISALSKKKVYFAIIMEKRDAKPGEDATLINGRLDWEHIQFNRDETDYWVD